MRLLHQHTQAHVQPLLFPPPCWDNMQRPRPHVSFRLFSSLGRSVTICTDGTARRQARDVFCVCLVTDLSSVHAWGGERPSVHNCCLWLAAFWLHQACRWASDWGPLMFCVSMWPHCSGHVIYTEKSKKGWKWPSLPAPPSRRGFRWVLWTGCLSLLTVLLLVEFILCIISVISGCKKDISRSHTNVTAKYRNSLF